MYYYIHISERIYSDLCRVKRIFYRNPKPLNGHAPFFLAILDPLDKNERIYSDFYALFKPILAIIVGGLNRSDWVGMLRFQQSIPALGKTGDRISANRNATTMKYGIIFKIKESLLIAKN